MLKQRFKSNLVFSLIAALVLSASFCLHILVMDVSASGVMDRQPATAPGLGALMMAASAEPSCCQNCHSSSGESLAASSAANMLNCCSAQTINPTITSASPDFSSHLATAFPAAAVLLPNSLVGRNYNQNLILSPPQAAALRSIVKLE